MTPDEKVPFKKTGGLPVGFGAKNNFYRFFRWLGFSLVLGLLWFVDDCYTGCHLPLRMSFFDYGALIGAIGSLVSAGVGAVSAGRVNRRGADLATSENRLNRDFQANQAAISRAWAENYYNEYQSPSSMVRQYEMAGLNPALMYGGAGASVGPSASVPSGSTSGSSMMPSFRIPDWSALADAAMQFAQIKNINADTDNKEREGKRIDASTQNILADTDVKINTIDEIKSKIKLNEKELDYVASQINKNSVEVDNLLKQGKLTEASEQLSRRQSKLILSQIGVNNTQIAKGIAEIGSILQSVKESEARVQLMTAQGLLIQAQERLAQTQDEAAKAGITKTRQETISLSYDNFIKGYDKEFTRITGRSKPAGGIAGTLFDIVAGLMVRDMGSKYNLSPETGE